MRFLILRFKVPAMNVGEAAKPKAKISEKAPLMGDK